MQKILFFIGLLLFLGSCKKDEPDNNSKSKPETFNIVDAKVIFGIVDADNNKKSYKYDLSGNIVPLKVYDENNNSIEESIDFSCTISEVFNLDEDYLILSGRFWGDEDLFADQLVDKNTGKFYSYNFNTSSMNGIYRLHLAGNYLYYNNLSYGICRVDISNPNHLNEEVYLPYFDFYSKYDVDKNGNVLICNTHNSVGLFKTENGNIIEFNNHSSHELLRNEWLDNERNINILTVDLYTASHNIYILNNENGSLNKELEISLSSYGDDIDYTFLNSISGGSTISFKNKVCFFSNYDLFYVYDYESKAFTEIALKGACDFSKTIASDDFLYLTDGSSIYKINPNTGVTSSLIEEHQYQIIHMDVDKNNNLYINALRNSDNQYIFAKINETNSFSVIDDQLNKEMSFLYTLDK